LGNAGESKPKRWGGWRKLLNVKRWENGAPNI
jgi:hypothetical protein